MGLVLTPVELASLHKIGMGAFESFEKQIDDRVCIALDVGAAAGREANGGQAQGKGGLTVPVVRRSTLPV